MFDLMTSSRDHWDTVWSTKQHHEMSWFQQAPGP